MHQRLLHQPTRRERKLQTIMQSTKDVLPEVLQPPKLWNPNIIYLPFTFESGPRQGFKRQILKWWNKCFVFTGSKVAHVQVKFATHTNRTLPDFFVRKKPPRKLLAART